jgi:hypothetical protein
VRFDDFVADEVSYELRMSWHGAADRISYACDLAGRLPVTFAALGAGLIDPVHAKIIAEQTGFLSAADAAKADPLLAAAAQNKTYAELRAAAAKLVHRRNRIDRAGQGRCPARLPGQECCCGLTWSSELQDGGHDRRGFPGRRGWFGCPAGAAGLA